MPEIRKVSKEHIDTIRELAFATWPIAYEKILQKEQLQYMLEKLYNNQELLRLMNEEHHQFIIAYEKDEPIAFASYSQKKSTHPSIYHLHKLYIHPLHQKTGIGKMLVDYMAREIKLSGASRFRLNVNRFNQAIQFYHKLGFIILHEENVDIGNGYFMEDYVMEKIL